MKSVPFGLALLLLWPASAPAQTTFSLGGGLNVARTLPTDLPFYHGSTTQGFAVQASVGRPYRGRFAWRIDAFVSQFQMTQYSGFAGVMCQQNPPPGTCCGICPLETAKGRVAMLGIAANQLVNVAPAAFPVGMYVIWGAETDYLYQHPTAHGALRLGASVGGGLTLPLASHVQGFVEARYHLLVAAPIGPTWLVPVTVGLRM
jgi:hypothetical protein